MGNDGNILYIYDENHDFKGTGFLYTDKYVITCHHCIYDSDKIFAKYKGNSYEAEWVPDFSKPEEDIAALRVNIQGVKPVETMMETSPGIDITIWAYSSNIYKIITEGIPVESKLSANSTEFNFPEELFDNEIMGKTKAWNLKPTVITKVYTVQGSFEEGYSGSPVFNKINNKVIGMFIALKGRDFGFIVPIERIFNCFNRITPKKSADPSNNVKTKEIQLFISKPAALSSSQHVIWERLQKILLNNKIPTKFLNPDDYSEYNPMSKVKLTLKNCDGVIVLGLKQIYIEKGILKKYTNDFSVLENYDLPTPWNDLEGGMAFMKGIPILIISEKNLGGRGIFDVQNKEEMMHYFSINSDNWWESSEFILTLNKWFKDVESFHNKRC